MSEDQAAANVNRTYSLAATSIAIFTFTMIFLYPRFASGEVDGLPFQATLIVMGLATFAFVFATLHFYASSGIVAADDAERARSAHRGDRLWMLGYSLLFLAPTLVLVSVDLLLVAAVWFALWLGYALYGFRYFPRVQAGRDG